jgi:hypothetical protein
MLGINIPQCVTLCVPCRSLNWVTTSHLECPFKETDPDVRDLLYTAINHVLEVSVSSFLFQKFKVLGIALIVRI